MRELLRIGRINFSKIQMGGVRPLLAWLEMEKIPCPKPRGSSPSYAALFLPKLLVFGFCIPWKQACYCTLRVITRLLQ